MIVAKNLWIIGSAFYLPLIWILGKKSQRLFLNHDLVPYFFLQIVCWWSARAVWNSLQRQLTKTKPRSALLPPPGTEGNPAFDLSIQQLLGRSARRLGDKDIDISFTYMLGSRYEFLKPQQGQVLFRAVFVFGIFSLQWRLFLKSLRLNTMGDESFGSTLRGPCRSIQQSLFSLVTLGNARSSQ